MKAWAGSTVRSIPLKLRVFQELCGPDDYFRIAGDCASDVIAQHCASVRSVLGRNVQFDENFVSIHRFLGYLELTQGGEGEEELIEA